VKYIEILFDGPPSPEQKSLADVNAPSGASMDIGEWIDKGDGLWALRITPADIAEAKDRGEKA